MNKNETSNAGWLQRRVRLLERQIRQLKENERARLKQIMDAKKLGDIARKKSPLCMPCESNASANTFSIKSPTGEIFAARNAQHFVRTHPHLFSEEDRKVRSKTGYSRAAHGLQKLHPANPSGYPIWKGWTWHWQPNEKADLPPTEARQPRSGPASGNGG